MKFWINVARILLLILLVVSIISCTTIPTCNEEGGNSAFRRAFSRRAAASTVGCPTGGGGGGGGGGTCNSQLSPTSVLFGLTSAAQFEQWEIATTGDLFLTCNTGTVAVGQTVTAAAGKYVYVFDVTKPQIFGFSMSAGGKGALTAIPNQPFILTGTFGTVDLIVADPLGRFLLVPSFETNSVHVLLISATGALSEAANSPFAVANPDMLTIDPSGSFVYIADTVDGDIFSATIDSAGQLVVSAIPIIPQSPPFWLSVNPNGHFLYSADALDVETFSITPITGGLVEIGVPIDISSFTAGGDPEMMAIDSTGGFLYLVFQNTVGILGFSITSGTGVLSQIQPTVFTGSNAAAIDQMVTDPFQTNMFLVSGGGIFNVPINTTNGNLTVPSLTVVAGTTPTTSGPISISSVP
jgi:6-phosphogluconolactonase (cycloisomerase 2 family)